jgi:hypothetical protein
MNNVETQGTSLYNGVTTIVDTINTSGTTVLVGTPNQINVQHQGTHAIVSLPQSISPDSNVAFGSLCLTSGAQPGDVLSCINASGYTQWLSLTMSGVNGVYTVQGVPNQIITSSNTGDVILSLPQAIAPVSSATFNALTVSGFRLRTTSLSGNILTCDSVGNGSWVSVNAVESNGVHSVSGTARQVIVSGKSHITTSLPQSIATNSNTGFGEITIHNSYSTKSLHYNKGILVDNGAYIFTTYANHLTLNSSTVSGYVLITDGDTGTSWGEQVILGRSAQTVVNVSGWVFTGGNPFHYISTGVSVTLNVNSPNVMVNASVLIKDQDFLGDAMVGIALDIPENVLQENVFLTFNKEINDSSYWNGSAYFSNVTLGNHTFYLSMRTVILNEKATISSEIETPVYIKALCV